MNTMAQLIAKLIHDEVIEVYDDKGRLHNDHDQPAVVCLTDGSQAWFDHGKAHRSNGPAFVDGDGGAHYWLHGEFCLQDDSARVVGAVHKTPVSIETLRGLYAATEDERVQQAVLDLAKKHGHAEHAVIFF